MPEPIEVKKVGANFTISKEVAMDMGLIPDTRPPYVPPKRPWHWHLREWAWQKYWNTRTRLGFWIAGVGPDEW